MKSTLDPSGRGALNLMAAGRPSTSDSESFLEVSAGSPQASMDKWTSKTSLKGWTLTHSRQASAMNLSMAKGVSQSMGLWSGFSKRRRSICLPARSAMAVSIKAPDILVKFESNDCGTGLEGQAEPNVTQESRCEASRRNQCAADKRNVLFLLFTLRFWIYS